MVLAVSLVGEIADRVVIVRLDVAGWEGRLIDPAKRIVVKRGCVIVRVLDAGQIAFRVVTVGAFDGE